MEEVKPLFTGKKIRFKVVSSRFITRLELSGFQDCNLKYSIQDFSIEVSSLTNAMEPLLEESNLVVYEYKNPENEICKQYLQH